MKLWKSGCNIWYCSPDNWGEYNSMRVCTINLEANVLMGVNRFPCLCLQLLAVFGGWTPVCVCWTCSCCCSGTSELSAVLFSNARHKKWSVVYDAIMFASPYRSQYSVVLFNTSQSKHQLCCNMWFECDKMLVWKCLTVGRHSGFKVKLMSIPTGNVLD